MTEQVVEIRGVRLGYQIDSLTGVDREQDGRPLVIYAHGLSSSRRNDRLQGLFSLAPVVAAGYRLLAYDARGHGTSTGSPDPEDYRWDRLADDLLAVVDRFSPDRAVAAIGCSMGTGTVLHAVLRRPDRFAALVLTAPPTAWQTRATQAGGYLTMADALATGDQERLAALFADAVVPPVFGDREPVPPDVAPELFPTVLRGAARADLPAPEALTAITAPTLLLPWETDPTHPVSTAEELARRIPGARLRVAATADEVATFGAQAAAFLDETVGRPNPKTL